MRLITDPTAPELTDPQTRRKEYLRQYRIEHREEQRAHERKWKARNRNVVNARKRTKRTGWSEEEYTEALIAQDGCCYICGNKTEGLHGDHCHKSGKKGRLLCGACNLAVGIMEHPLREAREKYLQEVR